jgi:hypothetical protein
MTTRRADQGGIGYLLVGQPSLSSAVARALATKGDQPQYIEGRYELGVQALNLVDFEYRWLRRINTFQAWASQAAVAAQNQAIQLGAGTIAGGVARNMITVCESVIVCNENAAVQRFFIGLSTNNVGAASGPFFGYSADDRSLDASAAIQSNAFLATQSNAGALISANRSLVVTVPANTSMIVPGPWVISGKPTTGGVTVSLVVAGGQSNIIVTAGFRWWERELLASEQ